MTIFFIIFFFLIPDIQMFATDINPIFEIENCNPILKLIVT